MEDQGLPGSDGKGWNRETGRDVALGTESWSRFLEMGRPKARVLGNQIEPSQADGYMRGCRKRGSW